LEVDLIPTAVVEQDVEHPLVDDGIILFKRKDGLLSLA